MLLDIEVERMHIFGQDRAVEFVADRETQAPYPVNADFAGRVCARCMEMGVLLYPIGGCADGVRGDYLMIAPPYTVTEDQVGVIVETLRQAIQSLQQTLL